MSFFAQENGPWLYNFLPRLLFCKKYKIIDQPIHQYIYSRVVWLSKIHSCDCIDIVWLSKWLCDCPRFPYLTLNVKASDKHEEILFVVWFVWLSKSCVIVQTALLWLYWHCVTVQVIMWLSKVPLLTLNVETWDKHEELLFVICFVRLCVTVQELCDCPNCTPVTLLTLCDCPSDCVIVQVSLT